MTYTQSILITNDKKLIKSVNFYLRLQLEIYQKKYSIKEHKNFGLAIYASSQSKIIEVINLIAPEHLEINFKGYKK